MMIHIASTNSKSTLTDIDDKMICPNAVDLRLDRIWEIGQQSMILSEDQKVMRDTTEVQPTEDLWYILQPGSYEVTMMHNIVMAEGESGFVITRSTLNRNGVFLTSGLYDSGYGIDVNTGQHVGGVMAACLHVNCGPLRIKKGTRIGQFVLFKSETVHLYDGSYGNHKQHDKKYT